jgi:thermostable hemolysin
MEIAAAQQLIRRRFAEAHDAIPATDYPHFYIISPEKLGAPVAALGFRPASHGPLFLESYLDRPIEAAVSERFGRSIGRERIVEIGALASDRCHATIALWARTARYLDGIAEVAVAVLTSAMRAMLLKLDVGIVELCEADPKRLPTDGARWGRYYETLPMVCAGLIGPAKSNLAHWESAIWTEARDRTA